MPISTELQAKIDALEDEALKVRIRGVLESPGKSASDEDIYEAIVSGYRLSKEQRDRLRRWKKDEVAAFSEYFGQVDPASYLEFIRQEREFNEISAELAWGVVGLIMKWAPGLDDADCDELFCELRDYVGGNFGPHG